jgi:outer membrane receptor protein involved in Fe transport
MRRGKTMRRGATKAGLFATAAVVLGGVIAPQAALAADASTLDEIVVTAQKRVEDVKDVPLSISVISGAQLVRQHIVEYGDLARQTPSLSFTNTGGSSLSRITLRGISSSQGAATVGVYLNDLSLTIPNQFFTGVTLPQLFDMDHVEVLRGPQGTLYGDSSLGGTLKFVTRQPKLESYSEDADAEVSTTKGGGTNYRLGGGANLPLSDQAALRLAVQRDYASGFIDHVNGAGDVDNKNVNTERTTAARATLLWRPTDDLKITPMLQWQQTKSDDTGITNTALPGFQEDRIVREPSKDKMVVASVDAEKTFGDLTLTSITGYMHRSFARQFDATVYDSEYVASVLDPSFGANYDAIAGLPGVFPNKDAVTSWSEELRLASPSISATRPYEWQVGAYFSHQKVSSSDHEFVDGLTGAIQTIYGAAPIDLLGYDTPNDLLGYFDSVRKLEQAAVFAEGSWQVLPKLKATVGVRETFAKANYLMNEGGWLADGTPAVDRAKNNSHPFTPKFALTYQATDDVSLYVNAAKGFRLGGQNNALPSFCASAIAALGLTDTKNYGSDSLWSYEGGMKGRFFGGRLSVDASAYYIDWKNIQQSLRLSSCGYVTTANAGKAKSQGGELQIRAKLADYLTLSAAGSITDAKITDAATGTGAVDGSRLLGVPDNSLNIGLDYDQPVTDEMRALANVNWSHTGKSHGSFSRSNSDYLRPSYDVVDASLGLTYGKYQVSLFAKNLFDKETLIQKPSVLFMTQGLPLRPRTVGVAVNANF